jgi:RimJ/RimL family protein N-acetyltransferase
MSVAEAARIARPLNEGDRVLVDAFYPEPDEQLFSPQKQPLIGVVAEGRLLSLAHSSRRTTEACELGIDTISEARRKGYALAATVLWSQAILSEGLVPIYSAFANNTASLRLAEVAGYRPFANITTVE